MTDLDSRLRGNDTALLSKKDLKHKIKNLVESKRHIRHLKHIKPTKRHSFFLPLVGIFIFLFSYAVEAPSLAFEEGSGWQEGFIASQIDMERSAISVDSDDVRGIYLTMWTASMKFKRNELIKLIDETDINSVVIDFKGSQGELIYEIWPGIEDFLKELREKNIYTIARVVVFQDSGYAKERPEFALKTAGGALWRDRRGFAWLDPASQGSWDHIIDVSKKSIDLGFDEVQFDYIRFPTDGNLSTIVYPSWDGQKPRSEVLNDFWAYSAKNIKEHNPRAKLSIDIFGYTFLRNDDLGIGQLLSDAINHFDYISPMVYPSHYGEGNFGFQNPAEYPYEVIFKTIEEGLRSLGEETRLNFAKQNLSGQEAEKLTEDYLKNVRTKIRPWIQVFDMGARYDSVKIKAQIQAIYDAGLTGWLMWDPNNRYNDVRDALEAMAREK